MTWGRVRRMTATSRPTASSSGALAKASGCLFASRVGHARVAVAEQDHLVVADDRRPPRLELLAADLGESSRTSGRVHGRVEDVALLAAGAADEHRAHALGVVAGDRAGPLGRLVVRVGVDGQQAPASGHRPATATGRPVPPGSWSRPYARRGRRPWFPAEEDRATCQAFCSELSNIFRAKANKVLDKDEDPRDTLDLSYEKQLENLQKVRRSVADVATARKRIELQAAQLQKQADKLQEQAKAALAQGNEDLAREALSRRAALGEQLGRPRRPSTPR